MGLYQTKKLLHSKKRKTNKNTKGACTEWEKIFANDIFYTGIISKIYKEFIQLNIKKIKNEQRAQIDIFLKRTHR